MEYDLGIDVGTTYAAAAILRAGVVEAVSLSTNQVAVPSVVFIADGETIFGAPAARRGAVQPQGVAREFKRRVGDPVPIMLSGSPYHADRLTALMAKWMVDTVSEQLGGAPRRTALAHPANWTEYQLGVLGHAIADVGLTDVRLISEPTAAALDYAAATTVEEGSLLLVYDLGGGTFDVAVLRRRGDRFEHHIEPFGIERLGGIDFDEAVFSHVIGNVPRPVVDSARETAEGVAAIANLRRSCVDAKEALSSDAAADVPVLLPGYTASIRITRPEFENMIRPMVEQTIAGVQQTIERADIDPSELSAALMIGGSSRIPLVSQMVTDELGLSVRVDAHPKLVVAKGAARSAGVADAVTTPPVLRRRRADPTGDEDRPGGRRWLRIGAAAAAVAVLALGGWVLLRDEGDDGGTSTAAPPTVDPTTDVPRTAEPTTADSPAPSSATSATQDTNEPIVRTTVPNPQTLDEWIDVAIAEVVRLDDGQLKPHSYAWTAGAAAFRRGWDDPLVADYLDEVYARQNPDGGYGTTFGGDAFNDGSENPADTTYAVTLTDHVGRVFLDGYAAGVVPAERVEEIIAAIESFPLADVPGTCIAYSTAPQDAPYCVDNVNSSTAQFLTWAADAGFDVDLGLVPGIIEREKAALIDGIWWPYQSAKPAERNDWQHEAMQVEAFLELDPPTGMVTFDAMRQLSPVPSADVVWDAPGQLPAPHNFWDAAALYRLAPYDCTLADPTLLGDAIREKAGDADYLAQLAYLGSIASEGCPAS